jgi:hypothetical protein
MQAYEADHFLGFRCHFQDHLTDGLKFFLISFSLPAEVFFDGGGFWVHFFIKID